MFVETLPATPVLPRLSSGARRCVRIGGVALALTAASEEDLQLGADYRSFQAPSGDCDIAIDAAWVDSLPGLQGAKLFDSGALWTLYQEAQGLAFDFITPVLGPAPYKRLLVDETSSSAQLLLNRSVIPEGTGIFPFEYPVDELLVTHWLSQGRGVEVHGCGLIDAEKGSFLFLGHSGAGKSTTTRLWMSSREVHVLSDDRLILRKQSNQFWMHGTPWHGEAGFASVASAPLERIFILEHGPSNAIAAMSPVEAVGELFARSFVPFYSPRALDSTLAYLQELVTQVPCYRFQFLPDSSAVEMALNFYGGR
ncbi:MAG: hypothetical protein JST79_09900 [Acidobacteria bacterium]|nr:hypothetical protein [Acidobacteriota bacterium]